MSSSTTPQGPSFGTCAGPGAEEKDLSERGERQKDSVPLPGRQRENAKPVTLDIHQILSILPHRFPFVMVDRVTEIVPGKEHPRLQMRELQ